MEYCIVGIWSFYEICLQKENYRIIQDLSFKMIRLPIVKPKTHTFKTVTDQLVYTMYGLKIKFFFIPIKNKDYLI